MGMPVGRPGDKVAVIGAGVMGSGIAEVFARAGYRVGLYSRSEATLRRAREAVAATQTLLVRRGLLDPDAARAAADRIVPTSSFEEALRDAAFVSESVPEETPLKVELLRNAEQLIAPAALLTTNTSGLSISEMGASLAHPERFLGLHWFNPASLMPVVEVVQGHSTSPEAADRVTALAQGVGKIPVRVSRDVPGFLINRLQYALLREAFHLVQEGIARAEDIDTAMRACLGLRWAVLGPMRLADLAGLDTVFFVSGYLLHHLSQSTGVPPLIRSLVESGRLGGKTGAGLFEYPDGVLTRVIGQRDEMLLSLQETLGLLPASPAGKREHG